MLDVSGHSYGCWVIGLCTIKRRCVLTWHRSSALDVPGQKTARIHGALAGGGGTVAHKKKRRTPPHPPLPPTCKQSEPQLPTYKLFRDVPTGDKKQEAAGGGGFYLGQREKKSI